MKKILQKKREKGKLNDFNTKNESNVNEKRLLKNRAKQMKKSFN